MTFPVPSAKHQALRSHSYEMPTAQPPCSCASGERNRSAQRPLATSPAQQGPWSLTLGRKKHTVALQETRNAGDRMDYNQDTHFVTSQEPQLGNNLDAVGRTLWWGRTGEEPKILPMPPSSLIFSLPQCTIHLGEQPVTTRCRWSRAGFNSAINPMAKVHLFS